MLHGPSRAVLQQVDGDETITFKSRYEAADMAECPLELEAEFIH